MRRIVFVMMSTITAVVLLFSYRTSTNSALVAGSPVSQLPGSPGSASPPRSSTKSGPATSKSSKSGPATYTGDSADTRWGPVQVRITVQGGKISSSHAVQYPQGTSRDTAINGSALPVLGQEAVQQQSASIDTVSGATVTSGGYLQSLQSAIDQAHL